MNYLNPPKHLSNTPAQIANNKMTEQLKALKPRKALNKAFLKVKPNRTDIESFKANLITLLDYSDESESEEFHKNLVSLACVKAGGKTGVQEIEKQLNQLVDKLYDLTEEEIAIVEGTNK